MRQAFIDAVNSLPVFSERQINNICPFFDSEREKEEEELGQQLMDANEDEEENDGPEAKRARPQQTRQYVPVEEICNMTMSQWRELVKVLKYENVKNLLP